ncbi:hypothetical protein [Streptomyces sp. NPDC001404]|uniref:hypothetical protein n=1 Tax=Streptomyces sp. NPDC001404 TaxID=3364571 RepID=UPI00368F7BB3
MNTPLTPEARALSGLYSIFPRRAEPLLLARLNLMRSYASARRHTGTWETAAAQLGDAIATVTDAAGARAGRRRLVRATIATVLKAIEAFERAHTDSFAASVPLDSQCRYSPAPGTEYPFSISDIGRAAARLLGEDWEAESTPWGVGAYLEHNGGPGGFNLYVDSDGDLYVKPELSDAGPTFLRDLTAADGLDTLAACVADTVRSFLDDDD